VVSPSPRRALRKRRRARLSALTVLGEILLLGGLATLGYLVWQPWYTSTVVASHNAAISDELSAQWRGSTTPPVQVTADAEIPVISVPAEGEVFGILRVPAMGRDYAYRMAEGTSLELVLNDWELGVGRYSDTQMPGQVGGNTSVAAHRSGPLTNPFREVMNLRIGDPLFIETPEGWYTYRFRSTEYVLPTEVDVLNPFPRLAGEAGVDQILTLTTCHPKMSGWTERAISYAVLEGFQPAAEGIPAEYTALIAEGA
jgi:sortase A